MKNTQLSWFVVIPFTVLFFMNILPMYAFEEIMVSDLTNSGINRIKQKAIQHGAVRVIVKVKAPSEDALSQRGSGEAQKEEIEQAKRLVVSMIKDRDVFSIKPLKDLPLIVMEVGPEAIDGLMDLQLVESIQEDIPDKAF